MTLSTFMLRRETYPRTIRARRIAVSAKLFINYFFLLILSSQVPVGNGGFLAQLVVHREFNPCVLGSNPIEFEFYN